MKQNLSINQSNVRAKIIGITFIIIGIGFLLSYLFNHTPLSMKIGFASIFIGLFMILMITEKSISKKTSDVQIEGNMNVIKKIIKELNLNGNAVFLPKSDTLTEERILIPPNETGIIKIPTIDNNNVFLKGPNEENLGISIPPAGLKLLKEIEKDGNFKNTDIENIDEKLQIFVGMNLLKSVSFKKQQNGWKLEIEKPMFCNNGQNLHMQYPGPTCSAVLTIITRALNQKIRIYDATRNGEKITFHINVIRQIIKQGE